jgi:hypothetical protein
MPAIIKTVGITRPDGNKDYAIHLGNGEVVTAVRDFGGKFRIGTTIGTIKELKWSVERGLRNDDDDDVTREHVPTAPQADRKDREPVGLWDCVHPCAIIVRAIQAGLLPCESEVRTTLDHWGWLDSDGDPAYDDSEFEYSRIHKLRGNQCQTMTGNEPSSSSESA